MKTKITRSESQSSKYIHVTLLDIFIGMLVHAILLTTLSVQSKESANRHARLIILVEEATGVAFHAEAAKPVPTDRLPKAPAAGGAAGNGLRGD